MKKIKNLVQPPLVKAFKKVRPKLTKQPVKVFSSEKLLATRNKLISLFETSGLSKDDIKNLLTKYNLVTSAIPKQKTESYNKEFADLWQFTNEALGLIRPELSEKFRMNVPVYDEKNHPVDFVATLLKGASHPVVVKAEANRYQMLEPLKPLMKEILISKGIAAPDNTADLARLFYNEIIAKKNTETPPLNFDDLPVENLYHLDESIVNAIVTYANDLALRKQAGEQLPKFADKIATKTMQIKQQLGSEAEKVVAQEVGQTVVKNSPLIITAVLAVIVLVAVLLFR